MYLRWLAVELAACLIGRPVAHPKIAPSFPVVDIVILGSEPKNAADRPLGDESTFVNISTPKRSKFVIDAPGTSFTRYWLVQASKYARTIVVRQCRGPLHFVRTRHACHVQSEAPSLAPKQRALFLCLFFGMCKQRTFHVTITAKHVQGP